MGDCTVMLTAARLYLLVLAGLWLIDLFHWQHLSILGLLMIGLPYYFLPLPLILLAVGVARARWTTGVVIALIAVGLWQYGRLYLPKSILNTGAPDITVVTFNYSGENRHEEDLIDWLHRETPDIVLLQETVILKPQRDQLVGVLDLYPYQAVQRLPDLGYRGSAVFSRYPFVDLQGFTAADSADPRSLSRVVLDVDGRNVAVYVISFLAPVDKTRSKNLPPLLHYLINYDESQRDPLIQNLLDQLAEEPDPYIVGGDFNMSDQAWMYPQIAAVMTDSFRVAGQGLGATFPLGQNSLLPPFARIDYIWHSDAFRTIASRLGDSLGSDHLPVTSVLEFK